MAQLLIDPELKKAGLGDPELNAGGIFDPEFVATTSATPTTGVEWRAAISQPSIGYVQCSIVTV